MARRIWTLAVLGSLSVLTQNESVQAAPVFLDFSSFDTRLGELATSAGVTGFSAAEVTTIKGGIKTGLETTFTSFTGLSFTEIDPGGTRAVINFGLTASPGFLGVADHIDFLNRVIGDTARVFSANFAFIVNEFSGSTSRATQISQLTAALGGTAAHELGHNLGLRHHDAHGDLTYDGTPAIIVTGGDEDTHVMATGSTGLSEVGRETARDFSLNSIVKLEYAAGTLTSNPTSIAEAGDAGSTAATAQTLVLDSLPVSGRVGEVVLGTIGSTTDVDVFRIDNVTGTLTADINIDYNTGNALFNNVNLSLDILDSTFTVIASNDVGRYTTTTFGEVGFGGGTFGDGFDPVLYNVVIATGTYYIRVRKEVADSDTGNYQLLIHTDQAETVVIPEPSSLLLLAMGGLGLCVTGLRRRRQKC
jgi:hypothetical protein